MDTQDLAEAVLDPLGIPLDRFYRMSPDVYQGMIEHGLLTAHDRVVFRDGLLVHEAAGDGDAENDPTDSLYRMPIDVYEALARLELLTKDDKTVLLDGLLVKKMTKGDPHTTSILLVIDAMQGLAGGGWHVRPEAPITLPSGPSGHGSVPEPDVSLARGAIRDYRARKPGPSDLVLVVEVADSSLRDDRKGLTSYAWEKIPVVWIVNLTNSTVEVYTRPTGPADPAQYEERQVYQKDDHVPVVIDGREVGRIAVGDLLP